MRLSKAPRKVYPHADVDALRAILDEAVEQRPRGHRAPVPADPRRHRRRVQHGRRHRPAARDRRGGRIGQRGGLRRRRPRVGRPRPRRPRLGRPLRAPRPRRDPGRDAEQGRRRPRRLRGRLAGPARHPRSSAPGRSSSRPRTRRPSRPPAARRSGSCRTSRSCIERLWANTRRFKAELARLGFDTGRSETPITPGDDGRPGHRRPVQPAPLRGGRLRPAGRLPDRRASTRPGSGRSSRPPTPTSSSTGRSRRSRRSAASSA